MNPSLRNRRNKTTRKRYRVLRPRSPAQPTDIDWAALLPAKPFLRVYEVAHMLDCSVDHIYRMLQSGDLLGGIDLRSPKAHRASPRVLRTSVLRFLQKNGGGR